MDAFTSESLEPQYFVPLFVGMWLAICALLAHVGGWARLAGNFRAAAKPEGQRFRFASGSMGAGFFPVSYGNCLFVTVNDQGFGLSILFLFRFLAPPIFIPWSQVESVDEKRFLFVKYAAVKLRAHWPVVKIYGRPGRAVLEAFNRVAAQRAL